MCLGSQQWRGREKQVSETHWPATRARLESFSSVTLSLNKWIVPEECLRLPLISTYLCVVHNCTYMHLYTQEHTYKHILQKRITNCQNWNKMKMENLNRPITNK